MISFFFFLFIMGLYCLCFVRKHIFMCLISLEYIIIYLLMTFYYFCYLFNNSFYMYIILMTFFVCEGALGMTVMVFFIRCHSNDYLNSMMLW